MTFKNKNPDGSYKNKKSSYLNLNGLEYLLECEKPLGEALKIKLKKIKALKKAGMDIYKKSYPKNSSLEDLINKYFYLKPGEKTDNIFKIAGRLMIFRRHGKATFCDVRDFTGVIQLYINLKNVDEEKYKHFLELDIGDWIGVEGNIFKTRSGELSINVNDFSLLSKAIRILPEKWHGLKDKELRYRQRYLDFIVNPMVKDVFLTRIKIVEAFRKFLKDKGFLEMETPMLQIIPGGAAARPFITHHNTLDLKLFLRIAPELYLKRLIIGGFEKVFEINRNFRNEGISYKHNPEFTMLEFYQAFSDYNSLMDLTEELIKFVTLESLGKLKVKYKGCSIDIDGKWQRKTMLDAINEFGGIKLNIDESLENLKETAKKLAVDIKEDFGKGKIINEIFESIVQPKLIQPTFIKDYPIDISPLARKHPKNENLVERFELFIGGEEIANAFSELIDPSEQLQRFREQVKSKNDEERITGKIDVDFLKALEYGMPPAAGEGIGIDRLVMVLTNSNSIRDVILFPLMKPDTE